MKRFLGLIIVLVFVVVFCLPWGTGWAGEENRPMVTSVAEEIQAGPNALLLNAAAKELGLTARFRNAPFKRRLIMMEKGELDMICGLLYSPQREKYIHYIHPPYKTRSDTIFFVRIENRGKIKRYEDLQWLKIGVSRGVKYFERFDCDQTLNKEAALSENNFRKLLLGRLDAVIQDESNGIFFLHKLDAADYLTMSPFRFSKEKKVFFGISRNSWMIKELSWIETKLKEFITSGKAGDIVTGYYIDKGLPAPAI